MSDSDRLRSSESDWVASNTLAFAVRDTRPLSPGHSLVMPRRPTATWFDATPDEQHAIMRLVAEVKVLLDNEMQPQGYSISFDTGEVAGKRFSELHVHVIPRYPGKHHASTGLSHTIRGPTDPWEHLSPLATGGDDDPFARHVLPLFPLARDIAIVAAFVQESGVKRILPSLQDALQRGARIRLLTGDYLNITQASALETLHDLESAQQLNEPDEEVPTKGHFETRVIEVANLSGRTQAFHPKSWRFESPTFGVAFVGSSNLSLSALQTGIEWNLRIDRDRTAYQRVCDAFDVLWRRARKLDSAWVDAYAQRARMSSQSLPPGEIDSESLEPPEKPHRVQEEALAALRRSREQGHQRALVVLATGLGKTWLAAFDFSQYAEELGRPPRLLFLAHRRELLRQAAHTYRRLLRGRGEHVRVGWFFEDETEIDADLVFASVLKLARAQHLDRLRHQHFDYVVIDEVHHAAADSYRRILAALNVRFVLGLTATPDRADAADILGLFDDHLSYRADVIRGINVGRLVPFQYFGLRDDIDYENIPWRNRRWDPDVLALAAQTEQRMQTLWTAWLEHPATRTLVFCCSISHACYVRDWLRARGLRVNAVFAGEGSDDRDDTLAKLGAGELDAVCAVDIFNEGVDVPALSRVVMLRPTESTVVFMQQLGRGLRTHPAKAGLIVIDFVGNHRVFLERMRTLLSLGQTAQHTDLRAFLAAPGALELPEGCSVEVALEAKQLLQRLFRSGGADEVERAYRELRDARGERPKAGELLRMGYVPGIVAQRHGSWFEFVRSESDLSSHEKTTLEQALPFFRELESTEMKFSFKIVALEALLEADALMTGLSLSELARLCHAIQVRSPELWADVEKPEQFVVLDATNEAAWIAYWTQNAVGGWTTAKQGRRTWFTAEQDRFALKLSLPGSLSETCAGMTRELVDYRLARYRARDKTTEAGGFVCKLVSNKRDPILKLPDRNSQRLPDGETDVRLPDGSIWQFRFMKEFVNVARPPGVVRNQLPDLMYRWFGPGAGQPGTAFQVRFHASPDGLWAEPLQTSPITLETRRGVVSYPDLRAAAGHSGTAAEAFEPERVLLPVDTVDDELFAVRVSGTSMDGGNSPLCDGDWAVMRLTRGSSGEALVNRVVLAQTPDDSFGAHYQIKRLIKSGGRWLLTSDNPNGPTIEPIDDVTAIARLERALHPEDLGPAVGARLTEHDLASNFGLSELVPDSGRYGGHLFVFVDRPGMLEAINRVRYPVERRRPSETAFVLARDGGSFRYLGVGRATESEAMWVIPEVDFSTWRAWGTGKEVSRQLPNGLLARAQAAVEALILLPEAERTIEQSDGNKARTLGRAQRGGVRLDGGDTGFSERVVSLTDIAWVIAAFENVREAGGLLDEERVNRLRYLEGTPKGSTRWIDTRWAIAIWEKTRVLVPDTTSSPAQRVFRDDGAEIDATFSVEKNGSALSVIFEARGGRAGARGTRNTQYAQGLETVLRRLQEMDSRISDCLVESRETASLSMDERRVPIDDSQYPIRIEDAALLRRKIASASARVARGKEAKGSGNQTRRIRLSLLLRGELPSVEEFALFVARGEPK